MASQAAANPYQELVECPLCLDQLKSPKLLPCGHGFCLDPCLLDSMKADIKSGKYKAGKIRCPMCKTDHTVNGLDSLPPDHKANTLISLIEQDKQKTMSENKLNLCSVCDGEKRNTACIYCISCRETMCILCQKQHEQKPENSQHATMSLNEKSMTVLMCKQHPKRYIVQYCDTCRHSVCNVCVMQSHGAHVMHDFRKINSGSGPGALITKLKKDLGSLKSDTAQKESQISDLITSSRAQSRVTQDEITCHIDALITNLQQQKAKLQAESQQSQKECDSLLLSQHKVCKDINREIVNYEEKLDRIIFPFENSQEIVLDKVPQKAFTPVRENIAKLERRCKDIVLGNPATHQFVPNNSSYEAGHISYEADSKHNDIDTSSDIYISKGEGITKPAMHRLYSPSLLSGLDGVGSKACCSVDHDQPSTGGNTHRGARPKMTKPSTGGRATPATGVRATSQGANNGPHSSSFETNPTNSNSSGKGSDSGTMKKDDCSICLSVVTAPKVLPCKHVFCTDCIDECFRSCGPKCPVCGQLHGVLKGTQPVGAKMVVRKQWLSIPGYEGCGAIVIDYDIPGGTQNAEHPNPGKRYSGTNRTAYLPNNREGNEILQLLQRAFDNRLIFTIGWSSTTGQEDQVTWNGIHHKTSIDGRYGYPDPGYLQRVRRELADKGIK